MTNTDTNGLELHRTPVRVLIVDDHPLIRKALAQLFADRLDFVVAGEAATCDEGYALALKLKPDLLLLDLQYGKSSRDGVGTLRALREAEFDGYIVILTVSDNAEDLAAAIRAGADGYLLKDTDPDELMKNIANVVEGQTVISPALAGALASTIRREPGAGNRRMESLTAREKDILSLLIKGLSNKLIAQDLKISEGTVKVHIKGLLRKLGFRSRLEAAVWAIEKQQEKIPGAKKKKQKKADG